MDQQTLVQTIENKRQQLVTTLKRRCLILGLIIIILAVVTQIFFPSKLKYIIGIGAFIFLFLLQQTKNKYLRDVKNYLVPQLINDYNKKVIYEPYHSITKEAIKNGHILDLSGRDVRVNGEDRLKMSVDQAMIETSDIHVTIKVDKNKRRTTFKGQYYIFHLNRRFQGEHYIRGSKSEFIFSDLFDQLETIETTNPQFNDAFTPKTNNKHEFYYIFTPHMIESIIDLHQQYAGKLSLSIISNEIHLAIDTKIDTFTLALTEELNEDDFSKLLQPIKIMKNIYDELDLDADKFQDLLLETTL